MSAPHPVDVVVGARLRQLRKLVKMSQADLATRLGLTFQQIQKYEKGANRISASKLFEASQVFNVSVSVFFEDVEIMLSLSRSESELRTLAFVGSTEGLELGKSFSRLSSRKRRTVLALVRTLAASEDEPIGPTGL